MRLRAYWTAARESRYSLLFALPLLLLYEGLSFGMTRSAFAGVRNGADVLLKTAFLALGGRHGVALFTLVVLGAGGWFVWRDRRRHPGRLERRYFLGMLGESVVYAIVFGSVASALTTLLLHPTLAVAQGGAAAGGGVASLSLGGQLVISLGAGIYEELLFRVLLVSGLTSLGIALGWRRPVAVGAALVVERADLLGLPLRRSLRRHADAGVLHVSRRRGTVAVRAVRRARLRHHRLDPRPVRCGACPVGPIAVGR